MKAVLARETNTITIATFWENFLLGKYSFDPPYQRKSVWSQEKQSFFIDSILKNFPIPPIFLHQHIDNDTGKTTYDVIDGKQRLLSIVSFIQNEIPVITELGIGDFDEDDLLGGIYFSDLNRSELEEYKKRFWRYTMPIEYIDTLEPVLIDNIFDRLNRNGEPLTGQELRNAQYHSTELLNTVEQLSDHDFWSYYLQKLDLARMENYEFISELLFVLFEGQPLDANQQKIDEMYNRIAGNHIDWSKYKELFCLVTSYLQDLSINYEYYKLTGVSHFYGLWCFAYYCITKSISPGTVRDLLISLFDELRSDTQTNKWVIEYKKSMSARTKSKNQRDRRLRALQQYCNV